MSTPRSPFLRRLVRVYLSQARRLWNRLSPALRDSAAGRAWAAHLDRLVRRYADRQQYFATFFLRNRPELELLCRIAVRKPQGATLSLAVLACSKGAEVYSIAWAIRRRRPDLDLRITALDISPEIVDFAARGVYSLSTSDSLTPEDDAAARHRSEVSFNTSRDQNAWMFERMSQAEIEEIFEVESDRATVRPWLRQGISWRSGDAGDPALRSAIGPQDLVIANRFLCHMQPEAASACLRSIGRLVAPGGCLFVTGIDLDVRTTVARQQGWQPISDLLEEIHEGDASIRSGWPFAYWGLEPLDRRRSDWRLRYACAFQVGTASRESTQPAAFAAGAAR